MKRDYAANPYRNPRPLRLQKPEQVIKALAQKEPETSLVPSDGCWYLVCGSESSFWRGEFIHCFIEGADSV